MIESAKRDQRHLMQPALNSTNTIMQTYLESDQPKEVVIIQCNIQTQNGVAMADEVDALTSRLLDGFFTTSKQGFQTFPPPRVLVLSRDPPKREGGVKWEDWTLHEICDGKIVRAAVEIDEF